MKKFLLILFSLLLIFSLTVLTACGGDSDNTNDSTDTGNGNTDGGNTDNGGDGKVCTSHIDENGDLLCDVCKEIVMPEGPKSAEVTFTVSDTDGQTLSDITVIFSKDGKNYSAVSDEDGLFTLTLETGKYSVFYEYDVDTLGYYLSETSSVTVTENTSNLTLYLLNNNPDGTAERPFALSVGENEVKIREGESAFFRIYHAVDLYVEITAPNAEIAYGGTVYTPNDDGIIRIDIEDGDTNAEINLEIRAVGGEINTALTLTSLPGTQSNPYAIESDGEYSEYEVTSDDIIYYTYTADTDGILVVTVLTDNAVVSMLNKSNSVAVSYTPELLSLTLAVSAGDEIIIDISSTTEEPITVSFSIALEEKNVDEA